MSVRKQVQFVVDNENVIINHTITGGDTVHNRKNHKTYRLNTYRKGSIVTLKTLIQEEIAIEEGVTDAQVEELERTMAVMAQSILELEQRVLILEQLVQPVKTKTPRKKTTKKDL